MNAARAETGSNRLRRIWSTVAAIPPGKVASYGQIAELAGVPRGARLVGRALGRAPKEMNLPWHRVINSQGKISLPRSSRGYARQVERLTAEAVLVTDGKVDLQRFRWQPDLDELVWGPAGLPASDS